MIFLSIWDNEITCVFKSLFMLFFLSTLLFPLFSGVLHEQLKLHFSLKKKKKIKNKIK